jgi:hypothetical protein
MRSPSKATAPPVVAEQERREKQREWCPTPLILVGTTEQAAVAAGEKLPVLTDERQQHDSGDACTPPWSQDEEEGRHHTSKNTYGGSGSKR